MAKITPFFKELLDKRWSEFAIQEHGQEYTSAQGVVFALIRACAKGKLPAIKEALDRIDGKIATEIEVEFPKFYFLFPYAETVAELPEGQVPEAETEVLPAVQEEEEALATDSIRDVLQRMSDEPRALVGTILASANQIDQAVAYGNDLPESDPKVVSVIVAGLLDMAHQGKLSAIFEVLDQIDGKVADKVKVLGGDVYVNRLDLVAPAGAVKNEKGVYQIEAPQTTTVWAQALERKNKNDRRFGR